MNIFEFRPRANAMDKRDSVRDITPFVFQVLGENRI